MSQAKTFTPQELRRVLDHVATRPHAARNRALVLISHWAGMRAGEISALSVHDVLDVQGGVRSEIRLDAAQTKGKHARVVYVNEKLRKELAKYVAQHPPVSRDNKFFYTQKRMRDGFTANTLAQFFHHLYCAAGIDGASSHSGRRSFATQMSSQGVGIRVLMRALGHRNISSTILYVDASDDMLRRAVELV